MEKTSIKALNISEIENLITSFKQPKFRTSQVLEWLYSKNVSSFDAMTNLPKSLLKELSSNLVITQIKLKEKAESADGTKKYIFQLPKLDSSKDIAYIESVAIPSEGKWTACISTQAGCPMGCAFCATGRQGFNRNLSAGEIVDQIIEIQNDLNERISNVVVMGQGEPFLNFENLKDALTIINDKRIIGIGARKITVSTCGIIPGINEFAKINKQFGLAISLHSAIQETRDMLMPGVKNYTLKDLRKSVIDYINKTNRRPTFEYIMLKNVNDTEEELKALANFCKDILCHINIINYNAINGSKYKASDNNIIEQWCKILKSNGIETTLRQSKGSDIDAACGQLINKLNK